MYNCYRERLEASLSSKTFSLWTFIHYNLAFFKNPNYNLVAEPIYTKVNIKSVCLWTEYYFRWKLSGTGNEFTPHDMKLVNTSLTTIPSNNNNNQQQPSNENTTTSTKHKDKHRIAVRFADDHQLDDRIKSASDSEEMQEKSSKKKKKHHKKRSQSISE